MVSFKYAALGAPKVVEDLLECNNRLIFIRYVNMLGDSVGLCLHKMLLLFHRSCLRKLPELFGMRNGAFEFDAYFDGQQASVSFCNSGCHSPSLKIWILDKKLSQ